MARPVVLYMAQDEGNGEEVGFFRRKPKLLMEDEYNSDRKRRTYRGGLIGSACSVIDYIGFEPEEGVLYKVVITPLQGRKTAKAKR